MKLLNIFKKETKKEVKPNIEALNKNQLNKVIGGGGPNVTPIATDAVTFGRERSGAV